MQLHIRYLTVFGYAEEVWNSHNVLRASPLDDERQRLLWYRVDIEPSSTVRSHVDRWGTRVDSFSVRHPHTELVVVAESMVETRKAASGGADGPDHLADDAFRVQHWLYLQPTSHTDGGAEVATAARELVTGDDVAAAIGRVASHVHDTFAYRPGSTKVGVDVNEVWKERSGVCQDYAHVTIALLRAARVPARYVSGYFYAADAASGEAPEGEPITVQTHAWVEAAVPGQGWLAVDPTNLVDVGERHVVIGRGRDYDDVTPLRGVYTGRSEARLTVEVSMVAGELGPRMVPVAAVPLPTFEAQSHQTQQ